MNHILDIQDKYFNDIKTGIKTFEIRRNNRNYLIGDDLTLVNLKTNESIIKTIIDSRYFIQLNFCLKLCSVPFIYIL